jgi:hypothetical protein
MIEFDSQKVNLGTSFPHALETRTKPDVLALAELALL